MYITHIIYIYIYCKLFYDLFHLMILALYWILFCIKTFNFTILSIWIFGSEACANFLHAIFTLNSII